MHDLLFGKGDPKKRRTYFWNLCASTAYSLQSPIMLWVVTRVGGLYEAGVFSILYTVTQTLASLGNYSIRSFQVSDTKNEYSFSTYFSSRVLTCILMVLAAVMYALVKKMPLTSIMVMLSFSLYRLVDGMEDVYHGAVQKEGRLDVVSIAMSVRIICSIIVFSIVYLLSMDLLLASICMFITAMSLMLLFNRVILVDFPAVRGKLTKEKVIQLLRVAFPVFLGAILYNYLVNAPKYAINRILNEEAQALFNILFMPIFAINILSMFIFKPMIVQMGVWWNAGELNLLKRSIYKQTIIIIAITFTISIIGYAVGCPVLAFIYGVDLIGYSLMFAMLLAFGGIAALSTFFSVVLTVMRKQIYIIVGYAGGYLVCFLFLDKIIARYGIHGAGYGYGIIMAVVFAVLLIASQYGIGKKQQSQQKGV